MGNIDYNEIPEKFFYVNDSGEFTKTIQTNQKLELSQYWANKNQQVGVIMLISGLILVGILLNETGLINTMWQGLLNIIGFIVSGAWL